MQIILDNRKVNWQSYPKNIKRQCFHYFAWENCYWNLYRLSLLCNKDNLLQADYYVGKIALIEVRITAPPIFDCGYKNYNL